MSLSIISFPSMSRPPSPISLPPVNQSDDSEHDPLYKSLEAVVQHPNSISTDWIDAMDGLNLTPRSLSTPPFNDGALYWLNKDDDLLQMSFPAVLDCDGKYSKIGPYFNLPTDRNSKVKFFFFLFQRKNHSFKYIKQKPTILALGKIKAVFELSPLTILSAKNVPQEAIDQSARAMRVLHMLYGTTETKRNERLCLRL